MNSILSHQFLFLFHFLFETVSQLLHCPGSYRTCRSPDYALQSSGIEQVLSHPVPISYWKRNKDICTQVLGHRGLGLPLQRHSVYLTVCPMLQECLSWPASLPSFSLLFPADSTTLTWASLLVEGALLKLQEGIRLCPFILLPDSVLTGSYQTCPQTLPIKKVSTTHMSLEE